MLIRQNPSWAIAESEVTPEHVFLNRRNFMGAAAGLAALGLSRPARAEGELPAA